MDSWQQDSELVSHADRSQWLDGRACSIGSSDAATILGYGYAGASRYSLWLEKCKGVRRKLDEQMLKMFAKGHAAEPYIAKLCEIEKGWEVQFDPPHSYRRNRACPYLTASLDAWMVEAGEPVAIEFKNVSAWAGQSEWDVRSGKAPLKYTIQLQHQLLVTGWRKGYLIALHGFDIYPVEVVRHESLIEVMQSEYADFWRCVTDQIEPEIDHSEPTRLAVQTNYPLRKLDARHLNQEETDLLRELEQATNDTVAAEKRRESARNRLVAVTGGSEYLVTADGQWFTFKGVRSGARRLKPVRGKVKVR